MDNKDDLNTFQRTGKNPRFENKPKCIIVDLEGTLSDHSGRIHFLEQKDYDNYNVNFPSDPINEKFIDEFLDNQPDDIKIILCTAKSIKYEAQVENWLKMNNLFELFDGFWFRKAVDKRPSVSVKYDQLIKIKKAADIICAYDDRQENVDMYRQNGVKAFLIGDNCPHPPTPDFILRSQAELFKSRNAEYGDGYKEFGKIIMSLFPDGLKIENQKDASRLAILNIMIAKLDRYCKNFHKGGHKDSLSDISVYAAMLQEVDES